MKPKPQLTDFQSKFFKFDALMQARVKHVLLVSSPYDSFVLEEDGQLTELIYNEYLELNLSITPHVKRASTAGEALEILRTQDIDLVIIFKRVGDLDVIAFGHEVKSIKPDMPVVFLAYHRRELTIMEEADYRSAIDWVFIWTGDVKILLSIIKLVEDRMNVDFDTNLVGVRVIVVIEDNVKFYSSYLPLFYTEIMQQTQALMSEGLNVSDKVLRMRARPKILLTDNYEDAVDLFERYRKYVLAVISDVRFRVAGKKDDEAGVKLVRMIRDRVPDLPILMQSSDLENAAVAYAQSAGFIHKRSPTLHNDISHFIKSHFGFGDFVFTLPNGTELMRASDFRTMEKALATVDARSIEYHGKRNHFSNWLMARTEFDLADRLRPRKVSEFKDVEALRRYLIETFKGFRHERQLGVVSDFSRRQFDLQSDFVRIGGGSLGGKGRGLAFINALLSRHDVNEDVEGVKVSVPHSVIIGTDVFDAFMDSNSLLQPALNASSDDGITAMFLKAKFPRRTQADLRTILNVVKYPLAVRSSSMLEDSQLEPAAGVYDTHMLTNSHPRIEVRLHQLITAIKLIYASTYVKNARVYHQFVGNRVEEEKMAVIIQQAIGQRYGDYFYPGFSGLALSYNYYSMDGVQPEDGVVYVALGLGKTIVDGHNCLRFSPGYPEKLPQFSTTKDLLNNSQHDFIAIDMRDLSVTPEPGGEMGLARLDLQQAEKDGTLYPVCSTYSAENDRVYDGAGRDGTRIVTFAPILKLRRFPLCAITQYLLHLGSQGLNCPVEIEFAVNLQVDRSQSDRFYFLQIRPMIKDATFESISLDNVDGSQIVAKSENALGNLCNRSIQDIVFVAPDRFDRSRTVEIAQQVGRLNAKLREADRKYLLIGPGRWGSSERWLGIPVVWSQISKAAVIVEAAYGDFAPDPSFGTHFFHNLTTFQVGYMTVNAAIGNGFIEWEWFSSQPASDQTEFVRHVELPEPLEIRIDGRAGAGLILKP